jgi:methylated-DNA-[protein]-cysteine S-methyltransferase
VDGYTLFDTAFGRCAIAWSERGVTSLQLPEASDRATIRRLLQVMGGECAAAPPPEWVAEAIAQICAHLGGAPQDLRGIRLDLAGATPFLRRVYEQARAVPSGSTVTYGELAARAGSPGASRAVGQAMARNRVPVVIPCHRVLAAHRAPGGFSAFGGLATKERLLALEGVRLRSGARARMLSTFGSPSTVTTASSGRAR